MAISGKLAGGNFPSTEAFITDLSDQNDFIGVGMYEGSPFKSLDGKTNVVYLAFNFTNTTDKKDNFTGVTVGNKDLNEWNKQFEKRNRHKDEENIDLSAVRICYYGLAHFHSWS